MSWWGDPTAHGSNGRPVSSPAFSPTSISHRFCPTSSARWGHWQYPHPKRPQMPCDTDSRRGSFRTRSPLWTVGRLGQRRTRCSTGTSTGPRATSMATIRFGVTKGRSFVSWSTLGRAGQLSRPMTFATCPLRTYRRTALGDVRKVLRVLRYCDRCRPCHGLEHPDRARRRPMAKRGWGSITGWWDTSGMGRRASHPTSCSRTE